MYYLNFDENLKSLRQIGTFKEITGKIQNIKAINWKIYTIFIVTLRTNHIVYIIKNLLNNVPIDIEPLELFGVNETPIDVDFIKQKDQIYCVLSSQISSKLGEIS